MERQRGQVLPVWIFGIFAMLVLTYFLIGYANVVRWQVRAQNAADAAAQAILALQTQQFNQMTMLLYASDVEEYRVRRLLNGMLLAAHGQGGCGGQCDAVYQTLRPQFLKAVQRYTNDVIATNRVTANVNFDTIAADAAALLGRLTDADACSSQTGGDCAFTYRLVDMHPRTAGLENVEMDALGLLKPSFSVHTGAATVNAELFAPAQVEVAVCARVPSILPAFFGLAQQPYYAIGRAAATAVMVEQDWLQPGQVVNPITGSVFQPDEQYVGPFGTGYDWYGVDFGGNTTQAYESYNVFAAALASDEFSAQLGWWNSIPIAPYTGATDAAALGCGG